MNTYSKVIKENNTSAMNRIFRRFENLSRRKLPRALALGIILFGFYPTISWGQALTVSPSALPNSICSGALVQLEANASGGTGTYTYIWTSVPAGLNSSISNPTHNPTAGTTYHVTVSDGSNIVSGEVSVTVSPDLAANVIIAESPSGAICSGTSVTFTATPANQGTAPFYQWLINGMAAGSNSPSFISSTLANSDVVSVVMTSNATCVTGSPATSNSIMMTVNPLPGAAGTIAGTSTVCQGSNSVSYSVPAIASATSYFWEYNGTGATITGTTNSVTISFNATATSGDLTVYGVNTCGDGAKSSDYTIMVNAVPSAPTVNLTQPNCSTETGTITVTAPTGAGMTYSIDGTTYTNSTGIFSLVSPGTYSVTARNSAGCISGETIATINAQPQTPVVSDRTATISSGETFTITPAGVPSGTTYSWPVPTYTGEISGGIAQSGQTSISGTLTIVSGTGIVTYTVTPTSGACVGNTFSVTVTVNTACEAVSIATQPVNTSMCAGGNASFTAGAGGTLPYAYQWQYNNGSTWVSVANGTPAGATYTNTTTSTLGVSGITAAGNYQYHCYVTNCSGGNNATSNTASLTVNSLPGQPTITVVGVTTFCQGGSVTLTAPAASSYLWSDGETTQSIIVTTSGSYTVQITNANGCQSIPSAAIAVTVNPVPAQPTITAGGPTTFCTGGSVKLTSSAGVTYSWSTGATTQSIDVTTAGNYTVKVGNAAGCQSVASAATVVTVNGLPAQPAITAGGTTTFCAGGSVTLTSSIGSSYLWSTGATTPSIDVTTSGSYTVRITNTEGCQSVASAATNVAVNALPAQPIITAGGATTFCAGGSVTLSSSVGTAYLWSTGAITQSIDVTSTGSYTVQVTNAADCQSIASAATAVTVNPLPVVNAGTDASVYNGGVATLNATVSGASPFTYSWTPASLLENATIEDPKTVNLSSTTTFTLTATSTATTCSNSDDVTIIVTGGALSSVPTATPSTVCTGSNVQLAAVASGGSGTYSYDWTSVPAGFTSSVANPTATPTVNTIYHVAVNDGSSTVNAQVSVTVNDLPSQPVITTGGSATFCAGSSVTLTSSAGTTYLWSSGATTQSITVYTSGSFTVRITNASGCQSITSAAVLTTVNALPSAPIVGEITPPTCSVATGSALFMGLPSTGTWILTRYPGTIPLEGSGASYTVDGLSPGIYNYSVTNASGCTSTLSANVNIPAQPATPTTPVVGTITQPTYIVPTGSVSLSGLPVSGSWTLTINPGGSTLTGTGTSRIVTGLDPGIYTFTVTNAVGCVSLPTADITINARPGVPNLVINNPANICSDQTADLTLPAVTAGSDANLTFTYWTDAAATVAYATPAAAIPGTYYIKGTSTAGFYNTKPVVVTADQLPVANAGLDQVLEYTFGATLSADIPEIGVGLWSLVSGTGEIFNATAPVTAINGLALGENVFRWSVTNGVCLPVTDDVMIKVNDLIIPTLITPNGDGRNDYFVLGGIESLGETELVIFDRRGLKVYENAEYDNTFEGLDYNSNPLPDDTYFYVVRSANGKSLSGYLVVRR